jgi:hypothetical protein
MTGRFTCLSCGARFDESLASAYKCAACFERAEDSKQRSVERARRRADDADVGRANLRHMLLKGKRSR